MPYKQEFIDLLRMADPDIKPEEIVDLSTLKPDQPTSAYVKFIYENVGHPKNPFSISPFELFLIRKEEVNAWAFHNKGLNIITIYLKLYKVLEDKIVTSFPTIKGAGLDRMNNLRPALKTERGEITCDYLLYQYATMFCYFHELGHLHQQSRAVAAGSAPFISEEKYSLVVGTGFNRVKHAMEIDTDIFAANLISEHIRGLWTQFEEPYRTDENYITLVSMGCAAIFIFFYVISGGWGKMYFLEYSHPHPLIRSSYIADGLGSNGRFHGAVDPAGCLQNGLEIARELLIAGGEHGIEEYISLFGANTENINQYIHAEMAPFMKTLPYLIQNWHPSAVQ